MFKINLVWIWITIECWAEAAGCPVKTERVDIPLFVSQTETRSETETELNSTELGRQKFLKIDRIWITIRPPQRRDE